MKRYHLGPMLDEGDDKDDNRKDMKDEKLLTLFLGLIRVMMRMMTGRM